jgi:hypothetical protein
MWDDETIGAYQTGLKYMVQKYPLCHFKNPHTVLSEVIADGLCKTYG